MLELLRYIVWIRVFLEPERIFKSRLGEQDTKLAILIHVFFGERI